MNANEESLKKIHGDGWQAAHREIAERGGFGDVPASYGGGLDLAGVLSDGNDAISSKDKDRIAELAGVTREKATDLADKKVGTKPTPTTASQEK